MITYGTKNGYINAVLEEIRASRAIDSLDPATEALIRKEVAELWDCGFTIEEAFREFA